MAENLGAIRYEVEIETASMLKAEGLVNKSITNQVKAFDKADKAVRDFETSQKNLGRTINSMGQVMNANGKVVVNATQQYRGLANTAQSGFTSLNTQINKTNQAVKSAMPNMTNMSYQIQDIAVQAQMGTSPFVIFAQQFPQMAVGMGAAAGAIGAVVAILGAMGTALIDTTTSMQKLEKSIERVQAVITIGANGVANYSEEMRKLSTISEALTRIKLQNALAEQTSALKNNAGAMREAWKEAGTLFDQTSSGVISEVISDKDQKKLKQLSAYFNAGKISLEEFNKEAGSIKNAMTGISLIDKGIKNLGYSSKEAKEQGVRQLIEGLDLFSTSAGQNTKAGRELSATITDLVQKYKEGQLTLEALNNSLNGVTDSFDKNASTIKDLTNEFVINAIRLKEGERAAFKFGLQLKGLNDDQVAAQLSLFDYNKELEKTKEDAEESAKAIKSVNDELDSFFDKESKDSTAKEDKRKATLTTQVQSIGLTPLEEIQARYKQELELLNQAEEQKIEIEGSYADRRLQIEKEKQDAIRNMQGETSQFMEDAFGNLDTQIAGTMAQVITGAKDGREAMSALANTILTQVIGAVVQWGIAEVTKLFTVESAEKGIQAANAAATTASVSAQVAMNTALAAQNAFMATAAIPLVGPVLAPAAAAAAGAASAAIGASAIPLAPVAGARQFGGPVSSGMYRVNETGVPEVYSQGGKDYLMNTKNANITPLDKAGSGSSMSVEVNNYTPYQVFVTRDEAAGIAKIEIGNEAGKLQKGRGSMYNAMKSGGNYSNNAKR